MRHQRLVAPFARGSIRFASTEVKRTPGWKRELGRLFGWKEEEKAEAQAAKREEIQKSTPTGTNKIIIGGVEYDQFMPPKLNDNSYEATESVNELAETVGTEAWLKKSKDNGEKYTGYARPRQVNLDESQWADLIRHTIVETLVLVKHGRNPEEVCNKRRPGFQTLRITRQASAKVKYGAIELVFAQQDDEKELLENIRTEAFAAPSTSPATSEEPSQTSSLSETQITKDVAALDLYRKSLMTKLTPSWQASDASQWLNLPISDPNMKLAIFRRITQLTSHRVNATLTGKADSLRNLVKILSLKTKPTKIKDTKQVAHLRTNVPNVTVHDKRRTMIHKEQDIGRWKLIEQELGRRDLPVTGNKWPSKTRINVV